MFSGQKEGSLLWEAKMKKLVGMQLISSLLFGFFLLLWLDWPVVGSFILGGILVSLNAWVMAKAFASAEVSQKSVYRSAVFRYVSIFLALFFLAVVGVNLAAEEHSGIAGHLQYWTYSFQQDLPVDERNPFMQIHIDTMMVSGFVALLILGFSFWLKGRIVDIAPLALTVRHSVLFQPMI